MSVAANVIHVGFDSFTTRKRIRFVLTNANTNLMSIH
nr:MAG TPA: hypothetical protein [Caudoviricetes sp.]